MNRLSRVAGGAAFLCSLVFCAWTAAAQSAADPSVAIIDMQRILRESMAVQTMQREIDQLRTTYQAEFQEKEQALRASDQELARDRATLSAEAVKKRRQELEIRVAEVQREIQERRRQLDTLFGQGMSQVRVVLVEIVQEIAKEKGADLVLTKSTVVLVKPELEITDQALEALNARLPNIELSLPQN